MFLRKWMHASSQSPRVWNGRNVKTWASEKPAVGYPKDARRSTSAAAAVHDDLSRGRAPRGARVTPVSVEKTAVWCVYWCLCACVICVCVVFRFWKKKTLIVFLSSPLFGAPKAHLPKPISSLEECSSLRHRDQRAGCCFMVWSQWLRTQVTRRYARVRVLMPHHICVAGRRSTVTSRKF